MTTVSIARILASLALPLAAIAFSPSDAVPQAGQQASDFTLPSQDGTQLSLKDFRGTVIVGVSVDSTDSHKDFCAQQGLTFKLLADTNKKVVEQYGSLRPNGVAARNTFLIDPEGKITKVWTGVDPSHHSEEVLKALAAMNHK